MATTPPLVFQRVGERSVPLVRPTLGAFGQQQQQQPVQQEQMAAQQELLPTLQLNNAAPSAFQAVQQRPPVPRPTMGTLSYDFEPGPTLEPTQMAIAPTQLAVTQTQQTQQSMAAPQAPFPSQIAVPQSLPTSRHVSPQNPASARNTVVGRPNVAATRGFPTKQQPQAQPQQQQPAAPPSFYGFSMPNSRNTSMGGAHASVAATVGGFTEPEVRVPQTEEEQPAQPQTRPLPQPVQQQWNQPQQPTLQSGNTLPSWQQQQQQPRQQQDTQQALLQLEFEERAVAAEEHGLTQDMLYMLQQNRSADEAMLDVQQRWSQLYQDQMVFQNTPVIDLSNEIAALENRVGGVKQQEAEVTAQRDALVAELRVYDPLTAKERAIQDEIELLERRFAELETRRARSLAAAERICEAEQARADRARHAVAQFENEIRESEINTEVEVQNYRQTIARMSGGPTDDASVAADVDQGNNEEEAAIAARRAAVRAGSQTIGGGAKSILKKGSRATSAAALYADDGEDSFVISAGHSVVLDLDSNALPASITKSISQPPANKLAAPLPPHLSSVAPSHNDASVMSIGPSASIVAGKLDNSMLGGGDSVVISADVEDEDNGNANIGMMDEGSVIMSVSTLDGVKRMRKEAAPALA